MKRKKVAKQQREKVFQGGTEEPSVDLGLNEQKEEGERRRKKEAYENFEPIVPVKKGWNGIEQELLNTANECGK